MYERETDSLEAIRDNLQTAAAAALSTYDPPTKAELDTGLDAVPTVAEIRAEMDVNSTIATTVNNISTRIPGSLTADGNIKADALRLGGALYASAAAALVDAVWVENIGDHAIQSQSAAEALDAAVTYSAAILDDTGSTGVVLSSANDVYHADINVAIDNLDTRDEYTITWFKNGVRLTGGITNAKIQVVKREDGADLIEEVTPDPGAIGSTGSFAHNAEGAERMEPGEAVLVIASATIDSATRSFSKLVSRDAEA